MNHQPFRVELRLSSPMVAPEHPIHLDGVLEELLAAQSGYQVERPLPLPLSTEQRDGEWVYQASAFQLPRHARGIRTIVRRPEPEIDAVSAREGLAKLPNSVTLGTGPNRAYVLSFPVQKVDRAIAYGIGDMTAVRSILEDLKGLGAKRRLGYGEIERRLVEPCEPHECPWWDRAMPWASSDEAQSIPMVQTVHPPYWDRTNQRQAWLPLSLIG